MRSLNLILADPLLSVIPAFPTHDSAHINHHTPSTAAIQLRTSCLFRGAVLVEGPIKKVYPFYDELSPNSTALKPDCSNHLVHQA